MIGGKIVNKQVAPVNTVPPAKQVHQRTYQDKMDKICTGVAASVGRYVALPLLDLKPVADKHQIIIMSLLTLDQTTLFYWNLSNTYNKKHAEGLRDNINIWSTEIITDQPPSI